MELNFNIETVTYTEFGVGRDLVGTQKFSSVPVGDKAQSSLAEMASDTWQAMQRSVEGSPTQTKFKETILEDTSSFVVSSDQLSMQMKLKGGPTLYEPSEKYAGTEYLYVPIDDDKVVQLRDFHTARNLDPDNDVFDDTGSIFCYFARFLDDHDRRLTAIRRATTMKGALKKKTLSWNAGILELVEPKLFVLDSDFDILIDSVAVHIWRSSSFESVGKLQNEILGAVSANIAAIQQDIDFMDFGPIQLYAGSHVTAARYLASIRTQTAEGPISKGALMQLCAVTGVMVEEQDGKIVVAPNHYMGFLEVLDRRRYGIELIEGKTEPFRATSRQRINLQSS